MAVRDGFEVVRDPLWNNIGVDGEALAVLDSEPFQRLRYIRQLGHAFLVYPGATHTRFEHALGTYHLAGRALALLRERGMLDGVADEEQRLVRLAALLHDIGHYPFSHALEEAGLPSHEDMAVEHLRHQDLAEVLSRTGMADVTPRLMALITGQSESPLQGLISGPLDLDKIEYLTRDARMCGVPYGTVDVDRLMHSLAIVDGGSRVRMGLSEKGLSALESLLFAKYQMYRNVYWHHAVRSATAMFKRLVRSAIERNQVTPDWIARTTDEGLMEKLRRLPETPLAGRLRHRRLYKRVLDIPAGELPAGAGAWVAGEPTLTTRVEDRLAEELGLAPGELLLDFPVKPAMLTGNVPVVNRAGELVSAQFGIRKIADDLHTAARRFRVFAGAAVRINRVAVCGLVERDAGEVKAALSADSALAAP